MSNIKLAEQIFAITKKHWMLVRLVFELCALPQQTILPITCFTNALQRLDSFAGEIIISKRNIAMASNETSGYADSWGNRQVSI